MLQPQDFSLSYDSQKLFVEIAFVGRKSRKWLFSSKLRNYFGRRSAKLGIGREKNILGGIVEVVGILDMDHWELETSFYV